MTAPTKASAEWTLAAEITEAAATDPAKAAAIALRASRRFPNFEIPAGDGRTVTFGQLNDFFAGKAKAAEPVAARVDSAPAPAPEKATRVPAPRKAATSKALAAKNAVPAKKTAPAKKAAAAPVVATPVKTEPAVLRIVHNGVDRTSIFGIEKDSPAQRAIGSAKRGGLGWWFFRDNLSFYIPGSQGYAIDRAKVNEAVARLNALVDESGAQLYRVDLQIVTEVDGVPLPVRKTREELKSWQEAYNAAQNTASWQIGMGIGECGTCGAKGLGEKTARIGKDANGMPITECATCGGFAAAAVAAMLAPVMLALPAAPTPVPAPVVVSSSPVVVAAETAECPRCKTMQPVKGGKLRLHSANGAACRGKLGQTVADVEPEAAEQPAPRKEAARKVATPVEAVEATGLMIHVQIQRTLSRSKQGDVATQMRQAIMKRVTGKVPGMSVEVRRDKATGVAAITVTNGAGQDAAATEKAIIAAVTSVAGFGNRVNK